MDYADFRNLEGGGRVRKAIAGGDRPSVSGLLKYQAVDLFRQPTECSENTDQYHANLG